MKFFLRFFMVISLINFLGAENRKLIDEWDQEFLDVLYEENDFLKALNLLESYPDPLLYKKIYSNAKKIIQRIENIKEGNTEEIININPDVEKKIKAKIEKTFDKKSLLRNALYLGLKQDEIFSNEKKLKIWIEEFLDYLLQKNNKSYKEFIPIIEKLTLETKKLFIKEIIEREKKSPYLSSPLLFDLGYSGHGQSTISHKIALFLQQLLDKDIKEGNTTDSERIERQKVIDEFESSKGLCQGLSSLWMHGKRISEDCLEPSKERDDEQTFKEALKLLNLWDEQSEFSDIEIQKLERFIQNIKLYQMSAYNIFEYKGQGDLSQTMYDTKYGFPKEIYKSRGLQTKETLKERLRDIIKPRTMIFLNIKGDIRLDRKAGHSMSVYQGSDGFIYFYDSNRTDGDIRVKTLDDLVDIFWKSIKKLPNGHLIDEYLLNVEVRAFRFMEDNPDQSIFPKSHFELNKDEIEKIIFEPEIIEQLADHRYIQELQKKLLTLETKNKLIENSFIKNLTEKESQLFNILQTKTIEDIAQNEEYINLFFEAFKSLLQKKPEILSLLTKKISSAKVKLEAFVDKENDDYYAVSSFIADLEGGDLLY